MPKTALIFGVSGQAGSYLSELLVGKGYNVVGVCNRTTDTFRYNVLQVRGDLSVPGFASHFIQDAMPDEIYNMASLMYAPASWAKPSEYMQVNGMAVVEMLEAIYKFCPTAKFFQAGSAEVFTREYHVQDESTPRQAYNPYGLSKILAEQAVRIYREQKGLFAVTGTFFNMESPRRPKTFFARKVAVEAVRVLRELNSGKEPTPMQFGNLSAFRDWGFTGEYVVAAHRMLQAERPTDYVIGTGETHSCLEFVKEAMDTLGLISDKGRPLLRYDNGASVPTYMQSLPLRIKDELGWEARTKFRGVVKMLVQAELEAQFG